MNVNSRGHNSELFARGLQSVRIGVIHILRMGNTGGHFAE